MTVKHGTTLQEMEIDLTFSPIAFQEFLDAFRQLDGKQVNDTYQTYNKVFPPVYSSFPVHEYNGKVKSMKMWEGAKLNQILRI